MVLVWNDKLVSRMLEAVDDGVVDATQEVYDETLRLVLDTPKTGNIYRNRLHKNATHQASAPNESFANETGNALKSTKTEFKKYEGVISADYEYALALELGTVKMAPRPTLTRALLYKRKDLANIISRPLKKVLER